MRNLVLNSQKSSLFLCYSVFVQGILGEIWAFSLFSRDEKRSCVCREKKVKKS